MVSQSLEQQSGLDEFLAKLSEGQSSTEGRFTVASDEMIRKLRFAISDTDLWIAKFVQSAVAGNAGFVTVRVGKLQLKCQIIGSEHLPLGSSEYFLNEAKRLPVHHHLLLCLVWLTKTGKRDRVQLRWSTESSVEQVLFDGECFHSSSIKVSRDHPYRFLELNIDRSSRSLVQKMFRTASFASELHRLESMTYLAPLTIVVDGRRLHQSTYRPDATNRMLFHSPGSSGLEFLQLPIRFGRLLRGRNKTQLLQKRVGRQFVEASAYLEGRWESGPSHLHWIVDGVVIQKEEAPACFRLGRRGFNLFLSANGLGTDLSTMALIEDEKLISHRHDQALVDWCLSPGS